MHDADCGLSGVMLRLLEILVGRWRELDDAINKLAHEIELIGRASELCQRLVSIPGVGMLSTTALVAAVGDASSSTTREIWLPGSGSYRGNSARAASLAYWELEVEGMAMCESS
jgi:transposase